jgi:hypothetical protein
VAGLVIFGQGIACASRIAATVRYTKLAPDRFKGFWKD